MTEISSDLTRKRIQIKELKEEVVTVTLAKEEVNAQEEHQVAVLKQYNLLRDTMSRDAKEARNTIITLKNDLKKEREKVFKYELKFEEVNT
eukprot:UN00239